MSEFTDRAETESKSNTSVKFEDNTAAAQTRSASADTSSLPPPDSAPLPVSRDRLSAAQGADPTLKSCFTNVSADKASGEQVAYAIDDGVLLQKWCPRNKY